MCPAPRRRELKVGHSIRNSPGRTATGGQHGSSEGTDVATVAGSIGPCLSQTAHFDTPNSSTTAGSSLELGFRPCQRLLRITGASTANYLRRIQSGRFAICGRRASH